ncbi:MAG: hypothetical protein ACLGJC_33945 [Alphaproteobacteria bacterium]
MSNAPKPPPRKNVALPPDVVERVDAFRKSQNITSESDALRRLIETGLNFYDKPIDLFYRCAHAAKNGSQIGEIIGNILNDHPLVEEIKMRPNYLSVYLRDEQEISLDRGDGEWSFGRAGSSHTVFFPPRENGYGGTSGARPQELDDEIPF